MLKVKVTTEIMIGTICVYYRKLSTFSISPEVSVYGK